MRRLGWICLVGAAVGCGRRDFNEDVIDAPIEIDAGSCGEPPVGCMEPIVYVCDGTCFAKCRQMVTRAAAAVACTAWGGCLGVANDDNANNCAASQLAGDIAWIGYQQNTTAIQLNAGWSWCDGSPSGFTAWEFAEPDDGDRGENGLENCAMLHTSATWTDEPCSGVSGFICSRPM